MGDSLSIHHEGEKRRRRSGDLVREGRGGEEREEESESLLRVDLVLWLRGRGVDRFHGKIDVEVQYLRAGRVFLHQFIDFEREREQKRCRR